MLKIYLFDTFCFDTIQFSLIVGLIGIIIKKNILENNNFMRVH